MLIFKKCLIISNGMHIVFSAKYIWAIYAVLSSIKWENFNVASHIYSYKSQRGLPMCKAQCDQLCGNSFSVTGMAIK
jgi:hypothetical protein